MTAALHADLAAGRWQALTLVEQLANIGSEVGRASRAKGAGNEGRLARALDRCLELFDLTLADHRWQGRRREIARARELVCDFLVGDNAFASTAESLDAYFLPFAVAARRIVAAEGHRPRRPVSRLPRPLEGTLGPGGTIDGRTAGQAQADADRAEIKRLMALSDREREAFFVESTRNVLKALADAQQAG